MRQYDHIGKCIVGRHDIPSRCIRNNCFRRYSLLKQARDLFRWLQVRSKDSDAGRLVVPTEPDEP